MMSVDVYVHKAKERDCDEGEEGGRLYRGPMCFRVYTFCEYRFTVITKAMAVLIRRTNDQL